jgi:hypothetical protein
MPPPAFSFLSVVRITNKQWRRVPGSPGTDSWNRLKMIYGRRLQPEKPSSTEGCAGIARAILIYCRALNQSRTSLGLGRPLSVSNRSDEKIAYYGRLAISNSEEAQDVGCVILFARCAHIRESQIALFRG